jgi:hypothetical protein
MHPESLTLLNKTLKSYLVSIHKLGFLFKIKPPARRACAPEGHAKKITPLYDLPDLLGRQAYSRYSEDYFLSITPEK